MMGLDSNIMVGDRQHPWLAIQPKLQHAGATDGLRNKRHCIGGFDPVCVCGRMRMCACVFGMRMCVCVWDVAFKQREIARIIQL